MAAGQDVDHEPGSSLRHEKKRRDTLIARAIERSWIVGYQDETWWSRLAQPTVHTWTDAETPLHLAEKERAKDDKQPVALCCYGLLRHDTGAMLLRFVAGQAVSNITTQYLGWVCTQVAAEGVPVLVLVWDNAPWHVSRAVRQWLRTHNQAARKAQRAGEKAVRIIPCWLPVKSPWLNPIEPKWLHGKKAIIEPTRILTPDEVTERVYTYYTCSFEQPIAQQVA